MSSFLVKLGKKPWSKYIMPSFISFGSLSYYFVHSFGHDMLQGLLKAENKHHEDIQLSDHLKELISIAYNDLKHDFNKPSLAGQHYFNTGDQNPPLKWFCSSLMEPITFGVTQLKTGLLIGLPSYFNYEKSNDIPDYMYRVSQFRLFKSLFNQEKAQETESVDGTIDAPTIAIDRNSPEVEEYTDSLILSDDAKKYSIAKELFIGDSYRFLLKFFNISMNGAFALSVSKALVKNYKLSERQLSVRQSIYLFVGTIVGCQYLIFSKTIDDFFEDSCHKKAIKINDAYKVGSEEYAKKRELRNTFLDKLHSGQIQ